MDWFYIYSFHLHVLFVSPTNVPREEEVQCYRHALQVQDCHLCYHLRSVLLYRRMCPELHQLYWVRRMDRGRLLRPSNNNGQCGYDGGILALKRAPAVALSSWRPLYLTF